MIKYLFLSVGLIVFLSYPYISYTQETHTTVDDLYSYFEVQVNENIGSGEYQQNILLVDSLIQLDQYKNFSCYQKAMLYHRKGQAYYLLQDRSTALGIYKDFAIPAWEDCAEQFKVKKANSIFAAAMSAMYINDFDLAIPYLNESLSLYESVKGYSKITLGHKYRGAGFLFDKARDFELSELFYKKSIEYFQGQQNSQYNIGITYNDLGVLKLRTGDYEEAVRYYKQSFQVYEGFELDAFHNLAIIYTFNIIDIDKAIYYANRLLDKSSSESQFLYMIAAYTDLAKIKHHQSNFEEARDLYYSGLEYCDSLIQSNQNVLRRAKIHEHIAESFIKTHNYDKSIDHIDRAIKLMVPSQDVEDPSALVIQDAIIRDRNELISMLALKANVILNHESQKKTSTEIDQTLQLYFKIDSLFHLDLSDISLNNSQVLATSQIVEYFEKAIDDFLVHYIEFNDIKYFESAYYFSSQLKALILTNTLKTYTELNAEDEDTLRDLKSKLNDALLDYYNAELNPDSLSSVLIKRQRDVYNFEQKAQLKYSSVFNSFSTNTSKSIQDIQLKLNQDEAILEYFLGPNKIYCFLIHSDYVQYHEIDKDDNTDQVLKSYIESCQDPLLIALDEIKKISAEVYSLIVEPLIKSSNPQIKKLVIIPDGILHALSFDALVTEKDDYLIADHEIVYSYSYKLYFDENASENEEENEKVNLNENESGQQYIGFGASYSESLNDKLKKYKLLKSNESLSPLKLSANEINESASFYTQEKVFVNEQATKSNFDKAVQEADILHLSMHAVVDYSIPDNSSLVFSDHTDDFILRASEVASHDLNTDMVILSSCQSAAGLTTRGEGVQGLSRAFMLAGTSSVLSSLWNASELSSSQILPSFVSAQSNGVSKSASLRQAKLSYLSSARPSLKHPFYWANYVLLTHHDDNQNESYIVYGLLMLAFMMIIGYFLLKIFKIK